MITSSTEPLPNYMPLMPRFWHGMRLSSWVQLLARHRFAIAPTRLPTALSITALSTFNSTMRLLQEALHGRRASATEIEVEPVFVLGHWRSGTTMLHEMLVLDERHNSPTTYQCFAPNHFLVTEWIVTRCFAFVLPQQRPMDNMPAGWNLPQEDEFALCNLGVPSPYLDMAFPNQSSRYLGYFDLNNLSEIELTHWKEALVWFLRRLTYHDPRRIVLKSPLHTARIKTILDVFPKARFVHIVRDPHDVYPSTIRLWRSLHHLQGLQIAHGRDLQEYVLGSFERMYERFEKDRDLISPESLYEVRFEDLVRDPLAHLRNVYKKLDLGDFECVLPRVEAYLDGVKGYRSKEYQLEPTVRQLIDQRWGSYTRRYGYS